MDNKVVVDQDTTGNASFEENQGRRGDNINVPDFPNFPCVEERVRKTFEIRDFTVDFQAVNGTPSGLRVRLNAYTTKIIY